MHTQENRKPELLCPAGSMESLRAALHFGADAVYGGMKRFGLRAFAGNFDEEQLREAVALCHAAGKKFYLTMNVFPFDDQLEDFVETAQIAARIGVDAAIVSDLGAIVTLRERVPELPLHVSTQASTVNAAAVRHYQQLGCSRVILAREVSIERVKRMHAQLDGVELETFVHGASCVAYSGRCLLSAVLAGRSGNQGECAQPCRWQYAVMEQKRPGEYLPVSEDTNGTYIFSAKDLNLMPLLPQLVDAGVASLKIEGRMKTEYYVATVTAAYRRAIDLLAGSREAFDAALPELMAELACASHRESDTGFMLGAPEQPGGAEGFHQEREYIARAIGDSEAGETARFVLKNRFHAGETLELLSPEGVTAFTAEPFLREKTGETVDTLGVGGECIAMRTPCRVREGDILRGQVRNHRR
ncbi:MAG: U32 family peptidase [Clostridiales bacterium]|nr:U32 family peptidase [Clostridiales bacterium]